VSDGQAAQNPSRRPRPRLPRGVIALGIVSMLMDTSSELVHSLLPLLLGTVLGAGMLTIGLIEGVGEATAAISKLFSGALSDHFRKRKPLTLVGYGLAALTKPVFPLAGTVLWVFGARFTDRLGKGIRGAPRDALIADITPAELRGTAYGLRQSLDSVGGVLGPLLALVGLAIWAGDIRSVLWLAVPPAVLCVTVLALGVEEPDHPAHGVATGPPTLSGLGRLGPRFWYVVAFAAVLTLARFSDAFLVLRADDVGAPLVQVPLVLVVMNIVYALASYPAGVAADRMSRRTLLTAALGLLVVADLLLALANGLPLVLGAVVFWGLHMGMSQGLLSALVADAAPADLRGTAFGVFHLVSGVCLLLASGLAGALWAIWGAPATFFAGALFTLVALTGLVAYRPASSRSRRA